MFYGREKQKRQINKVIESSDQMVVLIYGRRRIGKSELIKQCLLETEIQGIYFECKQTTEMNNVDSIAELISEKFHLPRLAFSGIEEMLGFLFLQAQKQKFILVLDEYPYLR